jgi:hypothetical protein
VIGGRLNTLSPLSPASTDPRDHADLARRPELKVTRAGSSHDVIVMLAMRATAVAMVLLATACARQSPEPARSAAAAAPSLGGAAGDKLSGKRVGAKLVQDAIDSPKTFTIVPNAGDGHGVGKFAVRVDGRYLWPPKGPGCDELARCCNALASLEDALGLSCLLAAGRDPDCATALRTSEAIAGEGGLALPPACPR